MSDIVVDTSAIIAILFDEAGAADLTEKMAHAQSRVMSAANYVELGTVLAGRRDGAPERVAADLDRVLSQFDVTIAPLTHAIARDALTARVKFGRGFGAPAGLNFGDSFAYALARSMDAPLLFVGNDFSKTDVQIA
jgi:ribonuclease VapC